MNKRTTTLLRSSIIMRITLVLVVILVSAAGCTSQPPQITVEGQYANLSPLFIGAGSVFLKVRNTGGRDALVGATLSVPNAVIELHDEKNGRMVRVDKISIPSRETIDLRPGSHHIMVFNMPRTVQVGSELTLTLKFERSGEKQVPVRFEKEQKANSRDNR
jgi:periplasmic copper chaperone A